MRIRWIGECPEVVPQLARWHVDAFADVLTDWQIEEAAFELRGHVASREVPTTLVGFEDSELVGSVSLLDSDLPAPDIHAPWLGSLFVAPAWRGRDLGAELVNAAVHEASALGLPALHLWTPKHAAYYAALGWQSLGQRRYGGIDVTLMRVNCRLHL